MAADSDRPGTKPVCWTRLYYLIAPKTVDAKSFAVIERCVTARWLLQTK